ncbi:MAG: hypothetical protein JNJ93_12840 [Acinetobacter sp.]|nr:hypothetical protein [Acinetobacter sp.]
MDFLHFLINPCVFFKNPADAGEKHLTIGQKDEILQTQTAQSCSGFSPAVRQVKAASNCLNLIFTAFICGQHCFRHFMASRPEIFSNKAAFSNLNFSLKWTHSQDYPFRQSPASA